MGAPLTSYTAASTSSTPKPGAFSRGLTEWQRERVGEEGWLPDTLETLYAILGLLEVVIGEVYQLNLEEIKLSSVNMSRLSCHFLNRTESGAPMIQFLNFAMSNFEYLPAALPIV